MKQLNEFAVNLPITTAEPIAVSTTSYPTVDITSNVNIPADVDSTQHSHISVYVDSAQVCNYSPEDRNVCVDLVLSVTCVTGEKSSTYKVVKRLSMDKIKLACDAECQAPATVVESEDDPEEIAKLMEAFYAAERVRQIAGLNEPKGAKSFKIMYTKTDQDKPEFGEVTIKNARDKAHALHLFKIKHPEHKAYRTAEVKE